MPLRSCLCHSCTFHSSEALLDSICTSDIEAAQSALGWVMTLFRLEHDLIELPCLRVLLEIF